MNILNTLNFEKGLNFDKFETELFIISFINILSIFINIGMWFERFVIVVTSLHRDFLPSSWSMYKPTITEIGIFVGTLGIFFTCFLLFIRFFPVIAIAEVKSILKSSNKKYLDKHKAKIQKYQVIGSEDVGALMEQLADVVRNTI